MGSSLPQHAQFKVVKKYDTGGIISPEASVRYGPTTKNPMLIFRDNCVLFADDRLYNKYSDRIESARPVNTRMKEITLKMPLADIPEGELKVITDGKTFIKVQDEGITELIQVKNELLTPENLSKPSQIIKAENGWKTDRIKKDKEYISYMLEGNDQVSIALLKAGWNNLSDILSFLFSEKELREGKVVQAFMKEYRNLQIFIAYQDKLVAGGLVSAGDGVRFYGGGADVPLGLGGRPGVLIYRAAEGAKLDLKEIASAAQVDYNTLKKLVEKRDIDGVGKLLENGNFQRLLDAVLRKQ